MVFVLKQRRITRSILSGGNRRSFFMVKGGWSVELTPSTCPSGYFCTSGSLIRVYDVLSCRVMTFTLSSVALYLVTVVCVTLVMSSNSRTCVFQSVHRTSGFVFHRCGVEVSAWRPAVLIKPFCVFRLSLHIRQSSTFCRS